jgi:hypothetical protein
MATSNISALAPTLFSAAQEVSAEPFGLIDSINASFDNKGVAKGDKVKVPVAPSQSNTTFDPSNVLPEGTAKTAAAVSVEITKSQKNSMVLTGEQIRSLENGDNYQEWVRQWAAQAMRALRNEAEVDGCAAAYKGASRAYGTAGTAPFKSSLADLVGVRKILRDNGAPMADLQCVIDTTAEVNMLNLGIVQQAFAAGSDAERRSGFVGRQYGFAVKASAGIQLHDSTAATSYALDVTTSIPVGTTGLVTKTGTDAVAVGDAFHLASDTGNIYIANALDALSSTRLITIGRPGTRAVYLNNATLTFKGDYTPNLAFERSAIVGIMRPPVIPANPVINQMTVSDGKGLTYLFLEIAQYGQITWEMHLAWGFKVVNPEHVAVLIG